MMPADTPSEIKNDSTELPDDIWEVIFSHLNYFQSKKAANVSRRFSIFNENRLNKWNVKNSDNCQDEVNYLKSLTKDKIIKGGQRDEKINLLIQSTSELYDRLGKRDAQAIFDANEMSFSGIAAENTLNQTITCATRRQ